GFALESPPSGGVGGQVRGHELDRHRPVQFGVERLQYDTHPAPTDDLDDLVMAEFPEMVRSVRWVQEGEDVRIRRGRRLAGGVGGPGRFARHTAGELFRG